MSLQLLSIIRITIYMYINVVLCHDFKNSVCRCVYICVYLVSVSVSVFHKSYVYLKSCERRGFLKYLLVISVIDPHTNCVQFLISDKLVQPQWRR